MLFNVLKFSPLLFCHVFFVCLVVVKCKNTPMVMLAVPNCTIPIYTYYQSPSLYQKKWIIEVITSDVQITCGCRIFYREQHKFDIDFASWRRGLVKMPPFPRVIFAFSVYPRHLKKPWEVSEYKSYLYQNAIIIHLNDEQDDHFVDFYRKVKTVYRNYGGGLHGGSMRIYDNIAKNIAPDKLFSIKFDRYQFSWWFPLGYSAALQLQNSDSQKRPITQRPLLFFWCGSVVDKPERQLFLDTMMKNQTLANMGVLKYYSDFQPLGHPDHIPPLEYSSYMYNSKVIPCPSGMSADQYRISETFEVGAIPVVQKGHSHLHYLDVLGLKYIALESFANITFVLSLVANHGGYQKWLERSQRHNFDRWNAVKKRISRHFAASICFTSTL